jgi:hypothetical protein
VTPAELRGLVSRAAAFLPSLAEFAPALDALPPGALSSLPPEQAALLAGIKGSVEAGLSEAKAADAAVAAVGQVLAQKRAAAERAHAGAAAAAAEFRELVGRILGQQLPGWGLQGADAELAVGVKAQEQGGGFGGGGGGEGAPVAALAEAAGAPAAHQDGRGVQAEEDIAAVAAADAEPMAGAEAGVPLLA